MKFHILSASFLVAASTLLPISTIAAPFNNSSRDFRVAQQQTEGRPQFAGRWGMRGRKGQLMEQLNLSTEQQENIQKIREDYKQQMQSNRQKIRELKQEMRQLMVNASKDDIRKQHQKIQEHHQKLSDIRLEMKLAIRDELTLEQREKMAELKQQRWERRRGKREQGFAR
ncbi:MAG: Spy/CpxP family protein refolding chaperone [Nostocaceae cyanobacterium]|nr:Spy/CpxP family protein refolding chaperone [Nostocaceae cyanobacterium]